MDTAAQTRQLFFLLYCMPQAGYDTNTLLIILDNSYPQT